MSWVGDVLKSLLDAPVSAVLVLAGIAFLALAVVGNVAGKFEPGRPGRIGAAFAGAVLLVFGLVVQWPTLFPTVEHKLDAAEVRQLLGRPHHSKGIDKSGHQWSAAMTSAQDITFSSPGSETSAHFRVQNDQLCFRYGSGSEESCCRYSRLPDGRFAAYGPDGAFASTFTVTYP